MDTQQARRIEEAAQKFAEAIMESYRAVSDRAVSAQELNAELTQDFFHAVIDNLRNQTDSNWEMVQELVDQQQRQQQATQALTQETVEAYMDFVNSMFSYGESVEAVSAPETSPEAVPESRAGAELPLEDYDSLNVEKISQRLGDLSVEEIERLRDYEVENKNRRTLIDRFNRRLEADSS